MRILVRLAPKASANRIDSAVAAPDGSWLIRARVTAAPDKGKANAALIALLADAWHIRSSALEIVAGATDRNKTLRIADDVSDRVRDYLMSGQG